MASHITHQPRFTDADALEAYRRANFHDYKPQYDIELKAMRIAEEINAPFLAAAAAKRERAHAKKLNNQRNRQARGAASQELKSLRNRGR